MRRFNTMQVNDPAFLYLALILPGLFSLTLIAEGIHKIQEQEHGWIPITFGVFFLLTIILGYLFVFR